MMAKHIIVERLEELEQDYKNAIADGNNALAEQIEMEIDSMVKSINDSQHISI